MKRHSPLAWIFLLALLAACQAPEAKSPPQLSAEIKTAILSVIQTESDAFYQRDFEKWQATYAADPVSWTCVEEEQVVLEAPNRSALMKFVGDYMEDNPQPDTVGIERKNFQFIPGRVVVWVSFDELQSSKGRTKVLKGVRLMRHTVQGWKISGMHSSFVRWKD
jgi:hypothetical protein